LAAEAGDHKRAVIEMEAFGAALADPLVASTYGNEACPIASAEEAVGNRDKADAAVQAGGIYVDCYSTKADILDGRGDWAAAQQQYQAAVDLAPDLPAAYYAWGMALARHGDTAGAKAKFAQANERGPHWADPLKAWGDVLAKEGNWREAMAKYDAALQYAPAWAALHSARDEAATHAG
jgi:tetratricopeptide (TPR) repeat protein